jgi:AraC family transcriptional regulator
LKTYGFKLLIQNYMISEQTGESLTFHLRNIALLSFDTDSDYTDIISPFSRMYLITGGCGHLIIGNNKILLESGNLYLIPGFTSCTYHFGAGLCHYYIHFSIDQPNGLSAYSLFSISNKTRASELDRGLFSRILEINPDLQLPHHHPNVYQNKLWMNKKVSFNTAAQHLETIGILKQLFSRFLDPTNVHNITSLLKYNIQSILFYIQQNLDQDISVNELAAMACFSKDHFTRIFKSIIGFAPCEFIIRKRIEKSQFLLLTTDMTHTQIMERTNFKSDSYFCRIFKKYTSYTPAAYRKQRG